MNKLEKIRQDIENKYINKIPNSKGKIGVCFSIDKDLANKLKKHCEDNGQYISWVVEKVIKEYLEK